MSPGTHSPLQQPAPGDRRGQRPPLLPFHRAAQVPAKAPDHVRPGHDDDYLRRFLRERGDGAYLAAPRCTGDGLWEVAGAVVVTLLVHLKDPSV